MHKPKIKALALTLLVTMLFAAFPLTVNASTGYILINTLTPPSTVGQQVAAGGNVSLYFGGVTWSGGQFYLLMSRDGYSQVSTGDIRYTPVFAVSNLTDATYVSVYTDPAYPGVWVVGNKWVNGTIKKDVAGGNYFIKAFDGTATAVAVTDTYITLIGAVEVVPPEGPAGAAISFKGYAFPPNALLNLSYSSVPTGVVSIVNLTAVNELGQFTWDMSAPDLKEVMPADENPVDWTNIEFIAVVNATGATYSAFFAEFKRGIIQVDTVIADEGNLYGNATHFGVTVPVGYSLIVAGNYFHPGEVALLWDGVTSLGTTTANATGFFNTTVTVPVAAVGLHNILIRDAGVNFVISLSVGTTLRLSPTQGPVGTVVTATGYGYPASTATAVYNVTLTWEGYEGTVPVAWALTDSVGMFTATFTVPHDYGDVHKVTGTANDTAGTSASANFIVTPTLVIAPSTFRNDGSLVRAIGTGFGRGGAYTPNIDNALFGATNDYDWITPVWANETGDLTIVFVAVGFRPGLHVFALYPEAYEPPYAPAAYEFFTVTAEGDYISDMLVAINGTLVVLKTDTGLITASLADLNAKIDSVNGTVVTISTNLGTVQTSLTNLGAKIDSVNGTVAKISTTLGTVTESLESIGAKVTSISDGVATIKTDLGTLTGKVTSIEGKVATIQTDVGTVKADVSTVKADVKEVPGAISGVTLPIWIAVVLSLIAAIASIYAVITIRRKIAG